MPPVDPASGSTPTADSEAEYEDEPEQDEGFIDEHDAETASGRGAWQGSRVTQEEIDWLIKSRRIPAGVVCRRPDAKLSPQPRYGERVVFVSHFERGFGLPVSYFFRAFLDKFHLQPHHLPPNMVLFLSALATFQEGYLGLWPTIDLCARLYTLSGQSKHDKDSTGPKQLVECGAAMLKPRKNSEYCKVRGPGSVKKWLKTWFYVKNAKKDVDLLNLPKYVPGPPANRGNWDYYPADEDGQTLEIYKFIRQLKNKGQLWPEDLLCTFLPCMKVCDLLVTKMEGHQSTYFL